MKLRFRLDTKFIPVSIQKYTKVKLPFRFRKCDDNQLSVFLHRPFVSCALKLLCPRTLTLLHVLLWQKINQGSEKRYLVSYIT